MRRSWTLGGGLLALAILGLTAVAPLTILQAETDQDGGANSSEEIEATAAAIPSEKAAGDGEETPVRYIKAANDELLKLRNLPEDSDQYDDIILQAYKIIGHGFHKFPRDPAMTTAYAAFKPIQLFRHFGWRIQGFLIHSPLDFRRYKNTVRRQYEQWRLTGNKAGMFWIKWFTDVPADAAFDVENGNFANSTEFPLFPDGESMQHWLVQDVFPEMENVAEALEKNVLSSSENFEFPWDMRAGFSNWALGSEGGFMQPRNESPIKRISRSEGLILATLYRTYIGWTKIFCAYNFNSFFKARSRFNEGKAFRGLAEVVKEFTLPDLFKLWEGNDSKGILDGRQFIKSAQNDLLTAVNLVDALNNEQFRGGDQDPAGRWFDYNTMTPWAGAIANGTNEMRALLSGPVALEDAWSHRRYNVNMAAWFDNPPEDLTLFLPSKVTSPRQVEHYVPFFTRHKIGSKLRNVFGIQTKLINPKQNVDLFSLDMHVDWQPTHDPGEWKDYTMAGLFPDADDRDSLMKGVYTLMNSRSAGISAPMVWSLVYGTLIWTN